MHQKILLVIAIIVHGALMAQTPKDIDRIFSDWDQKNHPGGVVLVSKAGKPIYKKAFGLANLQFNIPNTLETSFNLASVSKQFTALGIAVLVKNGKLSLDDPITKFLTEMPDYADNISVRNLLHHTSGIRSTPELFGLAGWREGDAVYTQDVYQLLCKQNQLNFQPGEEFMYSNSNYVLLALIIERIENEDFSEWLKKNVFNPLGMKNTYVDELNEILTSNTSTPYIQKQENQFNIADKMSLVYGASNVYSTGPDLMLWMKQLTNPSKKWEHEVMLITSTDTLNDGTSNSYAGGLFIDQYKGHTKVYHTGGIPGYLSFFIIFPDEQLSMIVLCNYLDYKANKRLDMLYSLFLEDQSETMKPMATLTNKELAASISGNYWNLDESYSRFIRLENDSLWYVRENGYQSPLVQFDDSTFYIGGLQALVKVWFEKSYAGFIMHVKDEDKPVQHFDQLKNASEDYDLSEFVGSFYSSELETSYELLMDDGVLIGHHSRHGKFEVKLLSQDMFNWSGMASVNYSRDENGNVTGFNLTTNRVRNVWFEKQ